jgi:hypothetical protein
MAKMQCWDCKELQVSAYADCCPECGAPTVGKMLEDDNLPKYAKRAAIADLAARTNKEESLNMWKAVIPENYFDKWQQKYEDEWTQFQNGIKNPSLERAEDGSW